MYALLVTAVLALTASPVRCTYYGKGDVYITQSNKYDKSAGVRFVFRPEQPELYSRAQYKAYLGFVTSGDYDIFGAYDNLTSSKYDGWTLMSWESYGRYYYADNLQGKLYMPFTAIAHAVDIFDGGEWVYEDKIDYSYHTQYSTYCVLDGEQRYDSEYKCSEALGEAITQTTTHASNPNGDDTITTGNNAGAIAIGLIIPAVMLILAVVLIVCARRNKRTARNNAPTRPVEDVEQATDQPSNRMNDTADSPPSYTIALNSSLPIESEPQVPKDSLEQLPSYASAVKSLSTEQLHDIYSSDHLSNVQNELPQQNINDTASHSDVENQA